MNRTVTDSAVASVKGSVHWSFETPRGYTLTVERRRDGRWVVVMGGFSRATDPDLRVALAEASGEPQDADWIAPIVRAIEHDDARRR